MRKKWTFSGIKRFFPSLSIEDWLKICNKRWHYQEVPQKVINGPYYQLPTEGKDA